MTASPDRTPVPSQPIPVAYLRRSSASTQGGGGRVSLDVQTAAVNDLATRHGDPAPETIIEWGMSGAAAAGAFGGTGRGGRRVAFGALRDRVAAGGVSAIYAYSLSRLARSTRDLLDLAELCAGHGVPIRLAKEGDLDFASPHGRLYLTVLAAVATFEAEVAGERARDRTASARDRGEYVGKPPFGYRIDGGKLVAHPDEMPVLERAREVIAGASSDRAAARRLNDLGIPSPTGRKWGDGTVRRIVARDAGRPIVRDRSHRGSPRTPSAMFARLLRCAYCGSRLTVTSKRYRTAAGEDRTWRGYECQGARADSGHPRPRGIAETAVLEWAVRELADLPGLEARVAIAQAADAERAALEARRGRLVDAVEHGTLTRPDVEARLASIATELAVLDERTQVASVPDRVDWEAPAAEVQAQVAAILAEITVDLAGPTFAARWRDESLRDRPTDAVA